MARTRVRRSIDDQIRESLSAKLEDGRKEKSDFKCPLCGSTSYTKETRQVQSRPGLVGPGNIILTEDIHECHCDGCTTRFKDPQAFMNAINECQERRNAQIQYPGINETDGI